MAILKPEIIEKHSKKIAKNAKKAKAAVSWQYVMK